MASNRDAITALLNRAVFEWETEALGRVKCNAVANALMPSNAREEIKAEELDGPTFVRKLLVRVARRIEEHHENDKKTKMETPLSESDIGRLTDAEIESFAREIAAHNTWLFESYGATEQLGQTNEKGERIVSVERRKVKFPRNEDERDSDYLVRAVRQYMTEQARRGEELVKSLRTSPLLSGLSGRVAKNIAEAIKVTNQNWRDEINRITVSSRMATDIAHAHRTWLRDFGSLESQAAQFRISTELSLGSITKHLALSGRLFAGVNFASIRLPAAVPELTILGLQDSIKDMTTTYRGLAESLRTYSDIIRLPRFVLPSATREVLATSYTANVFGVSDETDAEQDSSEIQSAAEAEIEEGQSNCIPLLEAVDYNLVRPYEGAYDALQGASPDRERQFLSSLRELYSHLMREIAPDPQVLEWIKSDNKDDKTLLHEGKPTRRARIHYVLRKLNNGPLTNFTDTDTQAFVAFLDVLQRVHVLRPTFSEQELRALWLRANSWLIYILQLTRSG